MSKNICIIGGGLAGSEAALQLAKRGFKVTICECRPNVMGPVHKTDNFAELVCSNSLKSEKEDSAAGLLKYELRALSSFLLAAAYKNRVAAGGALAVDRLGFAETITKEIQQARPISIVRKEVMAILPHACVQFSDSSYVGPFDAFVISSGPLTTDSLSCWLSSTCKENHLSFYDAAAPIIYAESLDRSKVFSQSRYEKGEGDYLNAPFSKEQYETFIKELINAQRVIAKDFESSDLFQACQPIEEIARKGIDAPRFGPLKPVGLVDPSTGKRPWAALQLRAEDKYAQSYNLVGFQTNLTFAEQKRVFRLIPGLEQAEFARYGVMHRNTFLDAPRIMLPNQEFPLATTKVGVPVYLAGQIAGTEGYCEAIRSGLQAAIEISLQLAGYKHISLPEESVYGALLVYATSASTLNYQPMHVNFGIMKPLPTKVKNKAERYKAYSKRSRDSFDAYALALRDKGIVD